MVEMTMIRCPGTKPHKKRRGNMIVTEEKCNTLLQFVHSGEGAVKCKDCKSVIHYTVQDTVVHLNTLPKDTKINIDEGKVVVSDS